MAIIEAELNEGAVEETTEGFSMVVCSGDFDRVMAAFIIANGAAAFDQRVTMFFTFWGLNALRKSESVPVKKTMIERMFGVMMPRGVDKLKLSKLNMMGMGTRMMKGIMKKHNAMSLPELIKTAQASGVTLLACTMTMDLMGIKKEELIDGIDYAGVATFLASASESKTSLFI